MTEQAPTRLALHESEIVASLQAFVQRSSDDGRVTTARALDAFVDAMRDAQYTPEQVVIAVKRATRRVTVFASAHQTEGQTTRAWDLMAEQCVSRAIRRFFEAPVRETTSVEDA